MMTITSAFAFCCKQSNIDINHDRTLLAITHNDFYLACVVPLPMRRELPANLHRRVNTQFLATLRARSRYQFIIPFECVRVERSYRGYP